MKKTILLLGGFGFIGSNFMDFLQKRKIQDFRILIFARKDSPEKRERFKNVIREVYIGDFCTENDVRKVFNDHKIDLVFHLISSSVPFTSNQDIAADINNNLLSAIRLLDLCIEFKIEKIIFSSSGGAVYGDINKESYSEEDDGSPNSSYGIIKITIEKYIKLYAHLYGIKYLCFRIANPYGLFHTSDTQGAINIAVKRAVLGDEFKVWGSGNNKKDYIFAEDLCRIIYNILESDIQNKILNIGTGKGISINEILSTIKIFQPDFSISYSEAKLFDVSNVVLKINNIEKFIIFELTPLNIGIAEIYNQFKQSK